MNGLLDKFKALIKKIKILIEIKNQNYDVVIVFRNNYSKSAELFARITNAQYKVGVKNLNGKDQFNIHIESNKNKHEVEFCFDCLKIFDITYNGEQTKFFISENLVKKYNRYKNCIVFHISARMPNNQISFQKLKEIIQCINIPNLILTTESKDLHIATKLAQETHVQLVTTDSFVDYGGLLKNAALLITLEGGSMHLGPALGIKTIALFGESKISRWAPWGYEKLVIQDKSHKAENISIESIIENITKG